MKLSSALRIGSQSGTSTGAYSSISAGVELLCCIPVLFVLRACPEDYVSIILVQSSVLTLNSTRFN